MHIHKLNERYTVLMKIDGLFICSIYLFINDKAHLMKI